MLKVALACATGTPPMITTEAAKLTHRQREVLTLLARQLSNNEVARLFHIAEATTNIDAEAILRAYAIAQEATSRSESSTTELIPSSLSDLIANSLILLKLQFCLSKRLPRNINRLAI